MMNFISGGQLSGLNDSVKLLTGTIIIVCIIMIICVIHYTKELKK
jgi:hypothetical protein